MALESPSGYSANVYPSSGEKNSLDLSNSSPDDFKPSKSQRARSAPHVAAAPLAGLKEASMHWEAGSASSSGQTGDTFLDEERMTKWTAELARLKAEKSRLRAEAAQDNLEATIAEIEAEKVAIKRSRSGKSGDSDDGLSARSTRSTRSTGAPAPSSSSGSALTSDNLRAHERRAGKSKRLQKVEEDHPPRAEPVDQAEVLTEYHPEGETQEQEPAGAPPTEVVSGRTTTPVADCVPPPADLGNLQSVKEVSPENPTTGTSPEVVTPPVHSSRSLPSVVQPVVLPLRTADDLETPPRPSRGGLATPPGSGTNNSNRDRSRDRDRLRRTRVETGPAMRSPPVPPQTHSASVSSRSGQASVGSIHAFELTVNERIRAFEAATTQRSAVERVQIAAEVSALRTEVQAAMANADFTVGASGEAAKATIKSLEVDAEEAIRSVQIQGSGVIASTEAWMQTQEQQVQQAVAQWLSSSTVEARAAAGAEAGSAAAGALTRVDASLASMSQLFEAERAQQKSEWDRERSELIRLVEQQRAAAAQAREESERKAKAEADAAREAHAADAERIGREAAKREARLISEAREALRIREEERDGLKQELAQLGGFVEQRLSAFDTSMSSWVRDTVVEVCHSFAAANPERPPMVALAPTVTATRAGTSPSTTSQPAAATSVFGGAVSGPSPLVGSGGAGGSGGGDPPRRPPSDGVRAPVEPTPRERKKEEKAPSAMPTPQGSARSHAPSASAKEPSPAYHPPGLGSAGVPGVVPQASVAPPAVGRAYIPPFEVAPLGRERPPPAAPGAVLGATQHGSEGPSSSAQRPSGEPPGDGAPPPTKPSGSEPSGGSGGQGGQGAKAPPGGPPEEPPGDSGKDDKGDEGKKPKKKKKEKKPNGSDDPGDGSSPDSDSSQFSDTPEGKDRRIDYLRKKIRQNQRGKIKEADKVLVPSWPEANKTLDWKSIVRTNLLAASGRPIEAAVYYGEIRTKTFEELEDPGKLRTLDIKFGAALLHILTGDLRTQVQVLNVEYEKSTPPRVLAGRQIYKLILEELKTEEGEEELHDFEDLQAVKMHKNNLRRFLRDWDMCILGLREKGEIGAAVYRSLFWTQVEHHPELQVQFNAYRQVTKGDPDFDRIRSYQYLRQCCNNYLKREKTARRRAAQKAAKSAGDGAPARKPGAPGRDGGRRSGGRGGGSGRRDGGSRGRTSSKSSRGSSGSRGRPGSGRFSRSSSRSSAGGQCPKDACREYWKTGKCSRSNCSFKHRKRPSTRRAAPGSTPRPNAPNRKDEICQFWIKGTCNRGKNCKFKHSGPGGEMPGSASAPSSRSSSRGSRSSRASVDKNGNRASRGNAPRRAAPGKARKSPRPGRDPRPRSTKDRTRDRSRGSKSGSRSPSAGSHESLEAFTSAVAKAVKDYASSSRRSPKKKRKDKDSDREDQS